MSEQQVFTHTNHPAFIYQEMLADQYRMQCYRRAIEQVVQNGDVVADLGTGTGVLAMMAVQAGAKHVYAIDNRPQIIPIARQIIESNGMSEQITVIEGDARKIDLDTKLDLIINELIGDFGTDENILECVEAIKRKHLKANGRVLPEKLRTFIVPVEYNDEYQGIWRKNFQGLDLSVVAALKCKEEAQMRILSHQPIELATPALIENFDFTQALQNRHVGHDFQFTLHTNGTLHGFMGYFQADLTSKIRIDNYPVYPGCHWQTWHWPAYPPRTVNRGGFVSCKLSTPVNMIAQGWTMKWSEK